MATVLFATQPLLFGYAFINQKDIPFMILFMGAVAAGVAAADRYQLLGAEGVWSGDPERRRLGTRSLGSAIAGDWRRLGWARRTVLGVSTVACGAIVQDLLSKGWTYNQAAILLKQAYTGVAPSLLQHLFSWIAVDAYKTPFELYLAKLDQSYHLMRLLATPALALALVGAFAIWLPSLRTSVASWAQGRFPPVLLAGGVLGLAVSVRQMGLFAGGLVSLYLIYRLRGKSLPALAAYWFVALLASYATWPYLWADPIGRFWHSITAVTGFGSFRVLYRGMILTANRLPWHYFPTLVSLQLTEPAVVLFLVGIPIIILRARSGEIPWSLASLFGAWIVIPVGILILARITVYDNIRHMLFVLPPMLILSGIGLDAVSKPFKRGWAKAGLALLAFAPGILGILAMHPYQYAYFNSFVGGVSGANGKFETDHWCTSYREAIQFVNDRAETGATVVAGIGVENAKPFQRGDLKLVGSADEIPGAEYILYCPGAAHERPSMPGFVLVYQVKEGSAEFAEVWERQTVDSPAAPN